MRDIRTDMAVEIRESLPERQEGVQCEERETEAGLKLTWVKIQSQEGARAMGKPMGNYLTLETRQLEEVTPRQRAEFAREIGSELKKMMTEDGNTRPVLIIGLGNRDVTPDALGPKVCEQVFVSRHIKEHLPEAIDSRAGSVCAIAPGVLGVTGLETFEVVKGIVEEVHPGLVIAIDALAARKTSRIGTSVQIADTGIAPGAGIGNHRKALSQETLGVKVIGIGVPMVAYARTIAGDILENALGASADAADMEQLLGAVYAAKGGEMIVTPKNIDFLVDKTAELLAKALNTALHPTINEEEIRAFME